MPTMTDYERRFQRSLQKLAVPGWYIENISSNPSTSSKQSLVSTTPSLPWKTQDLEPQRTPEIAHIRRPHSYRSCRSSLATSPSPSIHSWHPNHLTDGVNLSLLVPSKSPSSSATRRHHRYERGIERVTKSSQWYKPTAFTSNPSPKDQTISKRKSSTPNKNNHYDTPTICANDENLTLTRETNQENPLVNEEQNNTITDEKQQDNHSQSDEPLLMPRANQSEEVCNQIIPEETAADQNDEELQRAANDLVKSVLAEISRCQTLEDVDDQNSGVRELSEDENGLRELDENDINDTDEFILFATKAETSDDEQASNLPRVNQNKLYTFSKINEQISINFPQSSSRSALENNVKTTTTTNAAIEPIFFTSPIYQQENRNQFSHWKKHVDSAECPSHRHLSPAHQSSSEGVNEETARIGRLLLNQIPISLIETMRHLSSSRAHSEPEDHYQLPTTTEYDEDISDQVRHDSAYSSNQERIDLPQSIYEPLSDCYSGYTYVQSEFLTANLSSVQTTTTTTTDEAYESEPTTMCSSIATTTHVHPDLEHEFEYPSPPPPVPDRRLKPSHLKAHPPPVKPRLTKQDNIDAAEYSLVQKGKLLPVNVIQHLLNSTCDDSLSPSSRTMSSRHYCGSIPVTTETTATTAHSRSLKVNEEGKERARDKRAGRTLSCLHPATTDEAKRPNAIRKSSSSLNKTKLRKQKIKPDFDEATNGLAIRLPAPPQIKPGTPKMITTAKQAQLKPSNRPSYYETSV